jgi:hypothetical protein
MQEYNLTLGKLKKNLRNVQLHIGDDLTRIMPVPKGISADEQLQLFVNATIEQVSNDIPYFISQLNAHGLRYNLNGIAILAATGNLDKELYYSDQGSSVSIQGWVDAMDRSENLAGLILKIYTPDSVGTISEDAQVKSQKSNILVPGFIPPVQSIINGQNFFYRMVEPEHFEATKYKKPVERVDRLFR